MSTTRTISGAVLDTQAENNYFSDPYFTLKEGFANTYKVLDVEPLFKTVKGIKEVKPYAHRVIVKSSQGTVGLHAGLLSKAILVKPEELKGATLVKKDIEGVYYNEEVQSLGCKFSEVYERDEEGRKDFTYPEKLEVLGAYVFPAQDGDHPQVGLRHYPLYSLIRRHHVALTKDYLTWDEIQSYVEASGKDRPAGLPAGYKFELPSEESKWNMKNWNFRLIIKDWR
jgi:hypothetical protein